MAFETVAKWVWAIGGSFPHNRETVGDRPSCHTGWGKMSSCAIGRGIKTQLFSFVCTSHTVNPRKTPLFVCISHTVNPRSTFPFLCTSHTVKPGKTFLFVCTSHTVNPGKTFTFVCTSHTVLCIGSCVIGVTITHALPWLTICFYQLNHTRFDDEHCVALGYPSQALLLLEPFAKFHDRLFSFYFCL